MQNPACKSQRAKPGMQDPPCKIQCANPSVQRPACKTRRAKPGVENLVCKALCVKPGVQKPSCKIQHMKPGCETQRAGLAGLPRGSWVHWWLCADWEVKAKVFLRRTDSGSRGKDESFSCEKRRRKGKRGRKGICVKTRCLPPSPPAGGVPQRVLLRAMRLFGHICFS